MCICKIKMRKLLTVSLLCMVVISACGKESINLETLAETAAAQTAEALSQEVSQPTLPPPLPGTNPTPTQQKLSEPTQSPSAEGGSSTPSTVESERITEEVGAIAFVSDRDGDLGVYITAPNGSTTIRFTNNPADDYAPVWSSEDTALVYVSSRPGGLAMYLESVNHGTIMRLSDTLASSIWDEPQVLSNDSLTWSLSGQLAYGSSRCAANCGESPCPEIPSTYSGSSKEEVKRKMEAAINKHTRCLTAWWDGQVYTVDVYAVDARGGGEQYITFDKEISIYEPTFAPDSDKFAATISMIGKTAGERDIYLFDQNGRSRTPLVTGPTDDHSPSWSPDGKWIAFVSHRDGNPEIYKVDTNGENLERLTQHPADDRMPTWSPDGKSIVFTTNRDGNHEVYTLNIENQTLKNVSNHPANDFNPSWTALVEALELDPSPLPAENELDYRTNFDDFQAWFTYKISDNLEDAYNLRAMPGELNISMNETNGSVYSLFGRESNIADINLQASFETLPDSNRNSIDLICRASNRGWYEFGLDSGGLWSIRKFDHSINEYFELSKGGSLSINMQAAENTMQANCSGGDFSLWINGEMIAQVEDTQFKQGYFGIGVTTFDKGYAHVMFKSFQAVTP